MKYPNSFFSQNCTLGWFKKFILKNLISDADSSDESQLWSLYVIFLLTGLLVSVIVMFFREIFRNDLANPVAETATILMFTSSLFFALRNNFRMALNMIFFLPFLVYLHYLAGFSISAPPAVTIYTSLGWYLAGLMVLALWSPLGTRLYLYFGAALLSLLHHAVDAGLTGQYFTLNQLFLSNPFVIFTFAFFTVVMTKLAYERNLRFYADKLNTSEQKIRDFFYHTEQPLAQIRAVRDQDRNITRLEIEKINHAFESGFRISLQEAQGQELNYFFSYIFRNETNWNDLFIITPRQQTEIYSSPLDKLFILNILWFGPDTCFGLFNDMTKEMRENRRLLETKARYLALLEAIPDIFFVIDRDGTFRDMVFKGQENLLPETSEVIGNTIFKVGFSEKMAGKIYLCIQKTIDNDSIETIEYALETRGASLLFEMRLARLDDQSVISIARDITRRKRAEFELEAARNRADEANALKSKFLANLSHDIRTPMNIIIGLTKLLAEPGLSLLEKEEFIHNVQQQGYSLLHIIDNTIQLSKIETNTLDVRFEFTNIHHLLRELYLHFYPLIHEHRDLRLKVHTEIRDDGVGFETEPNLLKESLYRLIDNAVKFTTMGVISFGYTTTTGNSVEFFVQDTGPGIDPAEKENIFLRFYVIDSDRRKQKSGPGLGLPIAQHFVALLGGELMVDSSPGNGSRFWFRLPLRNARGFLRVV